MNNTKTQLPDFKAAIIAAAILTLVAVAVWAVQLANGLVDTNMRNLVPWGMGIAAFALFAALSGGALACGALPWALGLQEFKPFAKVSAWTAFACAGGAVAAIITDLGSPMRMFEMVYRGNLTSPLMYDMIALTVYAVAILLFLVMLVRSNGESNGAVRASAWLAIAAMVALQLVEAGIFASYPAHAAWSTPLMYPWFLVTALACGTGLALVVVAVLARSGYLELEKGVMAKACKWLAILTIVDACMLVCDIALSPDAAGTLVGSPLSPLLWLQVACMVVAIALALRAESVGAALGAGALVVAGACIHKLYFVIAGFQTGNLPGTGLVTSQMLMNWQDGLTAAYAQPIYVPGILELAMFVGIAGFVALLTVAGLRWLPLRHE